MKRKITAALACGCLPVLAACGGDSTPTQALKMDPVPVPAVVFPSSGLIGSGIWTNSDLINLAGASDLFNQSVADGRVAIGIPNAASATYNGTMAFTAPTTQPKEFYGRMTMDVDFGTGTLTGNATDFGLAKNAVNPVDPLSPLSGNLAFRRTTMNGPNFQTAMEGTLGGVGGPYVIRTQLTGAVYTNGDQSLVQGAITGDMSSDVIPVMNFSSGQFLATE